MILNYYLDLLGNKPEFLIKYLNAPSLLRLKKVGYFCGMDYASKDIYDFKECISRYDHSLTVALLTWKLTHNKTETLAALFHDIATPCFSHVIDYMNKDYLKQESTEEYTEKIILSDKYLLELLRDDNININDIIDFKKYTIVDNNRPKMCADRLDGVILTGTFWTKDIRKEDIYDIINDLNIYRNENNELEIGFKTRDMAQRVIDISKNIDIYCHSKEDNYMMELLASITKYSINKGYFTYDDLFIYNENELFNILDSLNDKILEKNLNEFYHIKKEDIKELELPKIKVRDLNPLVNGRRLL